MTKSATDVMHDIVFAAVIDAIMALKSASKGLPNNLLRDLNAVHANTTFADLPKELQSAIGDNVRSAFTRLLRDGYTVAPRDIGAVRPPPVRRDGDRPRGDRPSRPGPPRDRPPRRDGPRPPRPGGGPAKGPRGGR